MGVQRRQRRQQQKPSPLSNAATDEKPDVKNAYRQVLVSLTSAQLATVVALIFGGCCSNVLTLESIVATYPDSGQLITLVQFLFVAVEGLYHNLEKTSKGLRLRPPHIPLYLWTVPVLLYFSISNLNNAVWSYNVSVQFHIIFRSGGTILTMLAGVMFLGKRYSMTKTGAVVLLTAGVITATLANSSSSSSSSSSSQTVGGPATWDTQFLIGLGLLTLAAVLSTFQGIYCERIYAQYGRHWKESLFYTHFFSLVLFLPIITQIKQQLALIASSSPQKLGMLLLNGATQYLCVRGVNQLAGNSSALTVTIMLNIRKLVSLLLSSLLFGNKLSALGGVGAAMVFGGALLYAY